MKKKIFSILMFQSMFFSFNVGFYINNLEAEYNRQQLYYPYANVDRLKIVESISGANREYLLRRLNIDGFIPGYNENFLEVGCNEEVLLEHWGENVVDKLLSDKSIKELCNRKFGVYFLSIFPLVSDYCNKEEEKQAIFDAALKKIHNTYTTSNIFVKMLCKSAIVRSSYFKYVLSAMYKEYNINDDAERMMILGQFVQRYAEAGTLDKLFKENFESKTCIFYQDKPWCALLKSLNTIAKLENKNIVYWWMSYVVSSGFLTEKTEANFLKTLFIMCEYFCQNEDTCKEFFDAMEEFRNKHTIIESHGKGRSYKSKHLQQYFNIIIDVLIDTRSKIWIKNNELTRGKRYELITNCEKVLREFYSTVSAWSKGYESSHKAKVRQRGHIMINDELEMKELLKKCEEVKKCLCWEDFYGRNKEFEKAVNEFVSKKYSEVGKVKKERELKN